MPRYVHRTPSRGAQAAGRIYTVKIWGAAQRLSILAQREGPFRVRLGKSRGEQNESACPQAADAPAGPLEGPGRAISGLIRRSRRRAAVNSRPARRVIRNKLKRRSLCVRRNSAPEEHVGDIRSKDHSRRFFVDAGSRQPSFREVGNGAVGGQGRCRHSGERRPRAWPSRLARQSRPSLWVVYRPR